MFNKRFQLKKRKHWDKNLLIFLVAPAGIPTIIGRVARLVSDFVSSVECLFYLNFVSLRYCFYTYLEGWEMGMGFLNSHHRHMLWCWTYNRHTYLLTKDDHWWRHHFTHVIWVQLAQMINKRKNRYSISGSIATKLTSNFVRYVRVTK